MMGKNRQRLGELLVTQGWISPEGLQAALEEQQRQPGRLGAILVERGAVAEQTLLEVLSQQLEVGIADLGRGVEDPEAVSHIPYDIAKRYRVLPFKKEERCLHVAMPEPQDPEAVKAIEFVTGMRIRCYLCSDREIDISIEQHYGMEEAVERMVTNVTREASLDEDGSASFLEAEAAGASGTVLSAIDDTGTAVAPIIRLVQLILAEAAGKEASDIHFEPARRHLQVRFRMDGHLRQRMSIPKYLQQSIISRIKVMAGMDITKKRAPQDGGIRLQANNRRLDLRVSSLPTFYGEKIVIRLLDQSDRNIDLNLMGLDAEGCKRLEFCYRRPQGMVLVTGPTGSGKSTTLQCILKDLRSEGTNIVTVEDPIEYELEGINQVQVHTGAGLSFADSLRAILRQDPNVIMIGEIRDQETAEVAFRAAMTGHLVLSTLHTNDTVSTITRLVDMGVPRFLISSALLAVISQRLVRKICSACTEPARPDPALLKAMPGAGLSRISLQQGKGCSRCDGTGYKGRTGIYELLVVSTGIKEMIARGDTEGGIRREAVSQGMQTLLQDGLNKAGKGLTSLPEIISAAFQEGSLAPDPAVGSAADEQDSREPQAEGRRRLKIVFSEDDPAIREAVCLSLQALDLDVVTAGDGQEGWEKILKHHPDLIITDLQMPRMDGYGLLKNIRTDKRTSSIPVILLTGRNRCEDRMKGYLLGSDDYIEKPFDHRELQVRVRRCLDRRAG